MARAFLLLLVAAAALGGCASAPPPQVIYVDRYPPPPPPRVMMAPPWHGPECGPPGYAMRPPRMPPGPRYHPDAPKSIPQGNGRRVPQRRMGHRIDHERDSAQR